jgi:hypothetical protein
VAGITGAVNVTASADGDAATVAISGTYTGTLASGAGTANDVVSLATGTSIAGATIGATFAGLTITGGGTVTMSRDQHVAFSGVITATGTGATAETISLSTTGTVTAKAGIENYTLTAATGGNNITVLTATNVAGNATAQSDTITITAALAAAGTYTALAAADTILFSGTSGSIAGVNGGAVTGAGILSLATVNTINATMTAEQHNGFAANGGAGITGNGGDDTITLTNAGTIVADADIGTYSVIGGSTITVGAAAQAVTESSAGVTTVNIAGLTYTGTFTGSGAANDTLVATNGASIAAGAGVRFTTLNLTGGITMSEAAYDVLTSVVAPGATDQVTIADGDLATIAALAGIETYVIGEDSTGNAVAVTAFTGAQNVSSASVNDVITLSVSGTYTGTVTLATGVASVLSVATGTNIAGATIDADMTGLTIVTDGSVTMTALQFAALSATPTAGGTETITLTTGGTVTGRAAIEVYNLGATAANAFTFAATPTAATQTVNTTGTFATTADLITGTLADGNGGKTFIVNLNADALTDRISIVNTTSGTSDNTFQVNGFAVANDALQIRTGTTTNISSGLYQAVTAGSNTNVTVGATGVIEIEGSNAADLTADGNAGGIEVIISNAIGTIATGSEYTVIVYSGANAGIYQLTTTQGTDLLNDGVGFTVELVGTIVGVGVSSLTTANFF